MFCCGAANNINTLTARDYLLLVMFKRASTKATSSLVIVASWVSTNTFRATVTFTLVANTFQVTAAFPFALATPAFALVVIHTIIMDVVVINTFLRFYF